ncbi:MAG: hypothetical protein AAF696_19650, partial [Bacteroidota bacterium]
MNTSKTLSLLYCISLLICSNLSLQAQDLLKARESSHYSYIFQISTEEAKNIYKKDLWIVDSSFFHTQIDSFLTDSIYKNSLPPGHYLKTYVENNQQKFELASIQPFSVQVLNNTSDLLIRIYDREGKAISNAVVKVKGSKLRFDAKSQSFIKKKTNKKGLIQIEYQGITSFYQLDKQYKNSRIKRFYRDIAFRSPLKYVWVPIRFVGYLPIDGYKSIQTGYVQGNIFLIKDFFERIYERFSCPFDGYACENFARRFEGRHEGYLVFNKAKYRPGDTVKFKAFILNKRGKPIKKDLNFKIGRYERQESNKLGQLKAYAPGAYQAEFVLEDSLDLRLDSYQNLVLYGKPHQLYMIRGFEYEDYELGKIDLHLRTPSTEQFRNQVFKIFLKATNENQLPLKDARIEINLTPKHFQEQWKNEVFLPDSLWSSKTKLAPKGETEIIIPDSIFPSANLSYYLNIKLLTSDNEVKEASKSIFFYHKRQDLKVNMLRDSLSLTFEELGVSKAKIGTLSAKDGAGNKKLIYQGPIPHKVPLNRHYSSYEL